MRSCQWQLFTAKNWNSPTEDKQACSAQHFRGSRILLQNNHFTLIPSAPFCPQKTSIKTSFASDFLHGQHYLIWKETTMAMVKFCKYEGNIKWPAARVYNFILIRKQHGLLHKSLAIEIQIWASWSACSQNHSICLCSWSSTVKRAIWKQQLTFSMC